MTEVFKPLVDLKEVLGSYHARKIRKELEAVEELLTQQLLNIIQIEELTGYSIEDVLKILDKNPDMFKVVKNDK